MMYPGLASWAKFSRPCGTEFENGVLSHTFIKSPKKGIKRSEYFAPRCKRYEQDVFRLYQRRATETSLTLSL